ncbi:MAG: polyprenyl synthetase family protein [Deltaproteobacteria bacterium]|nr:polyprenyl synthetase family protein [Deltaproteobacteria bacterium]
MLEALIPDETIYPPEIFRAVRYSLFAGGKRIRPILCLAAAEAVGGKPEPILPVACAIEMIHTYSLIHDDLPAMDNDDYRRGRLTSHKVFGEDLAILAGDALLTEAFQVMTRREVAAGLPPARLLQVVREIAEAAGWFGMVGGQVLDVQSEGQTVAPETLYAIHRMKTGAMILVSLRTGAILAGAAEEALAALSDYGRQIGLAFQIADDILNVEGDKALLGKGTGSDAARGKVTFPLLLGLEASRSRAEELVKGAIEALAPFDEKAEPLRWIARYILERKS